MVTPNTNLIGAALTDGQAPERLRGAGCYVGDVALNNPLHLAFLRSPVATGTLEPIDVAPALSVEGVIAAHAGPDVASLGDLTVNALLPVLNPVPFDVLAQKEICGVGQPLAAVLATTPFLALDGVEALSPKIGDSNSHRSTPLAARRWRTGDAALAFAEADHVVDVSISHARLAPSPLEPRAIAIEHEEGRITVWHSTQTPHRTRSELARILGIEASRIRVIAPDVGGAFGMKASLYPEEVFAVWAALTHRRSVRWCATRSEDFLSATQGRGQDNQGRLAVAADGTFLALEARVRAPIGAWVPTSGFVPGWNAARILPGPYDIQTVDIEALAVRDPLGPVGIYRGAGRPEAACLMERLVDKAAEVTGMDAIELRKRNLYHSGALPLRTPTGNFLDSGDYPAALDALTKNAKYDRAVKARDQERARGGLAGLGVSFYLEPSGEGFETARVSWDRDGSVLVASGSSSQGHGRATAYAQIVAEVLGVPLDAITVRFGDSGTCPEGIGAVASRSTAIGGSAVFRACETLLARRLRGHDLPMVEDVRYETEGQAWGYGANLVTVRVDADTGVPTITEACAIDDAGRVVNPAFFEGQIRGGFAQGLGEALMEQMVYTDGQLLSGSFMDYAVPRAMDVPNLSVWTTQHPSPLNALGVKGIGEAGTIGAPAAILNAVHDALQPVGVAQVDMPLTPCKIWTSIQKAKGKVT